MGVGEENRTTKTTKRKERGKTAKMKWKKMTDIAVLSITEDTRPNSLDPKNGPSHLRHE
jgi:hypothetical protein